MLKDYSGADLFPAAAALLTGIAEIAHLCGVFFHRPFHFCTNLFGVLAAAALLLLAAAAVVCPMRRKKAGAAAAPWDGTERLLFLLFAAIAVSQLLFVLVNQDVYRQGDMTVETVGSFLETDAVWQVNPLTGQAYRQGMPSRLKILCLPTLYGALSSLFHLPPSLTVWRVAPILTLLGCYGAFAALGRCLFANNRKRRGVFLIAVALLLWAGSYLYGMDGFGVLYSGWRGVTIRNAVLLPWLFSLCLRKKWLPAVLCILTEACLVWTLYGMGACLFAAAGMGIVSLVRAKRRAKGAAGEEAVK